MIVSYSGIDSCGKGTQISLLKNFLLDNQIKTHIIWARGTWTPGVELIKKIVRKDRGFSEEQKEIYRNEARSNPKSAKIILILSILDLIWYFGVWYRVQNLFNKVLICDRYLWDTYVDFKVNFSNFNFDKWYIWKILVFVTPKPDVSVFLHLTAQDSYDRGIIKNEFFMETLKVKKLKVDEYENLKMLNTWNTIINATDSIESIFNQIRLKIKT